MSLINQMLKDLDKRHASTEGVQPLSGDVHSVMTSRQTSFLPLLALVVLIAAVGTIVWLKYVKPSESPEIGTAQIVAASAPASAELGAPVAEDTPAPVVQEEPVAPPEEQAVAAVPETAPLTQADKAADKPLSPAPNNVLAEKKAPEKSAAIAADEPKAAPEKLAAEMPPAEAPKIAKPASQPRAVQPVSIKVVSPQQKSDNYYRHAITVMQQGRATEAREELRNALSENPLNHDARLLLAGLLAEDSRQGEAISLLQNGWELAPDQAGFAVRLARLQVEMGDRQAGMDTLLSGLPLVGNDAEYHALLATLLQRDERHEEAVKHYLVALRSDPAMPRWLVGIGISLQALGNTRDAFEAYSRAQESGLLAPDLQQFVDQRVKLLKN